LNNSRIISSVSVIPCALKEEVGYQINIASTEVYCPPCSSGHGIVIRFILSFGMEALFWIDRPRSLMFASGKVLNAYSDRPIRVIIMLKSRKSAGRRKMDGL
jgi:hypothetical protein